MPAAGTPISRLRKLSSNRMFLAYRKSYVPEGGWSNAGYASSNGRHLRNDMIRVQKLAAARGMVEISAFLQKEFDKVIEEVIAKVLQVAAVRDGAASATVATKVTLEFQPSSDEEAWAQALREVMDEYDERVTVSTVPMMQSVHAETMSKSMILLGKQVPRDVAAKALNDTRDMGKLIKRINDTTRNQISTTIAKGLADKLPVNEVARQLRDKLPTTFRNRIPTIARTEMGRAADKGRARAMQESGVIKTIEVIGCQAVEPEIPTYQGRPTCNIKGVPVEDADKLEFHINHTGTMVPETFYSDVPEGQEDEPKQLVSQARDNEPELPEPSTDALPLTALGALKHPKRKYNADRMDDLNIEFTQTVPDEFFDDEEMWDQFFDEMDMGPDDFAQQMMAGVALNLRDGKTTLTRRANGWDFSYVDRGHLTMSRRLDIQGGIAEHTVMAVESAQGKGLSKTLMRNQMAVYGHLGIREIRMHANFEVGGYAWARYGFLPDDADWQRIREGIEDDLGSAALAGASPNLKAALTDILADEDPRGVWQLAALTEEINGVPAGKHFLIGSDWHGYMDLTDTEQVEVLMSYIY